MAGMPNPRPMPVVDSRRTASVSFAPPDPVTLGPRGRTPTRVPMAVGPGRAVTAAPDRVRAERGGGVSYPIQPGKVQTPALRDEILARTRLLDWLDDEDPQPGRLRDRRRRATARRRSWRTSRGGPGCGRSGTGSTRRIATGSGSSPISSRPVASSTRSSRRGRRRSCGRSSRAGPPARTRSRRFSASCRRSRPMARR